MKSLQERVELLEQKDAQNKTTADFLLCSLKSLLSEITKYRAKNSDDERILAFLDDLQEQQKRENEKEQVQQLARLQGNCHRLIQMKT